MVACSHLLFCEQHCIFFKMCVALSDGSDDTDFHPPEELSWSMLKQWFKAVYSRLTGLKGCLGNDAHDISHPKNFWAHNNACQEYVRQLWKVQREVEAAIDLARGTYFDRDNILVKKSNERFLRFKPYDYFRPTASSDTGNGVLSSKEKDTPGGANTPQPEGERREAEVHWYCK